MGGCLDKCLSIVDLMELSRLTYIVLSMHKTKCVAHLGHAILYLIYVLVCTCCVLQNAILCSFRVSRY